MMNTMILREMVMRKLESKGYSVKEQNAVKNGVLLHGIINETENNICPVVYLERIIEDLEDEFDLEDIVDIYVDIFEMEKPDLDIEMLGDRNFILERVRIGVQKTSEENLVKRECEFEGLETYLYVKCSEEASYKLTNELVKGLKLSYEELWRKAEENTRKNVEIKKMSSVINELMGTEEDNDDMDLGLYIITNKERYKGASSALDTGLLKDLALIMEVKGFAVLPSSIHEMILVPIKEDEDVDIEELSEMVECINHTEVREEERLTDRAYLFEI